MTGVQTCALPILIGVAVGYLIANMILFYPGTLIPFRLIELKVSKFLLSFKKITVIRFMMLLCLLIIKYILLNYLPSYLLLVVLIVLGAVIYAAMNYFFNKAFIIELYERIKA